MKRTRKIPAPSACPERFCYFWNVEKNRCEHPFFDCKRRNLLAERDCFEPYEPGCERERIHWNYFMPGLRKKRWQEKPHRIE